VLDSNLATGHARAPRRQIRGYITEFQNFIPPFEGTGKRAQSLVIPIGNQAKRPIIRDNLPP
jgi:hypothetical protein